MWFHASAFGVSFSWPKLGAVRQKIAATADAVCRKLSRIVFARSSTMPFIDISKIPALELLPGCRLRTPYGQNIMMSYLEMDEGAEVPLHHHPHEQAGMLL